MTTIQGSNGKTIHFAFGETIQEVNRTTYIAQMPIVICDNKKDAEQIQSEVGTFISELCKSVANKKLL